MNKIQIGDYLFYRSIYAPVESNMYVLLDAQEAIIIDSNISPKLLTLFAEKEVHKVHLFLTHEHYDHTVGISWLKENFNVTLYCHQSCSDGLSTKKRSSPRLVALVIADKDKKYGSNDLMDFKKNFVDFSHSAEVSFNEKLTIRIAAHTIQCIHTPGHSPGSGIYILDNRFVFSGDSLLQGNKVITSFRGGCKEDFYQKSLPILQNLPDDIVIMPGHGEPFRKKEFDFTQYNV